MNIKYIITQQVMQFCEVFTNAYGNEAVATNALPHYLCTVLRDVKVVTDFNTTNFVLDCTARTSDLRLRRS